MLTIVIKLLLQLQRYIILKQDPTINSSRASKQWSLAEFAETKEGHKGLE